MLGRILPRLAILVAAFAVLGSLAAAPASAGEAAQASSWVEGDGVMWFEAVVDGSGDPFTIVVKAPRLDGDGRLVWQRCSFAESTAGSYTCGVDVSEGSKAAAHDGTWLGKIIQGGETVARARETL